VTGTADRLGPILGTISIWSGKLYSVIPAKTLADASIKQFGIPEAYRELVVDDLMATSNPEFVTNFTRSLMKMELPTQAKVPVLVAVGEKETITAKNAARKLVQGIPGAKGVWVPGVGHVWNLQKTDLFTETLKAWIEGTPLPKELVTLEMT
jgi:pimeloyl-ACP methyl ester carboxylesterase